MTTKVKSKVGLSTFWLKVLACVFMFIDHFGVSVFPSVFVFSGAYFNVLQREFGEI